jgi:nucleoside-diphosphate-sugar epimerase
MNRHFLITGATGFIGGAATVAALRAGYGPRLLLLSRPLSDACSRERLLANLRRLGATDRELRTLGEDYLVEADLAEPASFRDLRPLEHVERVIHAAALPTFSNNPAIASINVDGTLALAHALNPDCLERFLFVSTAMAVGPSLGRGAVVPESQDLGGEHDHLVPYTASKAEAERRLRTELADLPLVVARPSIVVGHTELGVAPSQSIFWVFMVGHMLEAFTCDLDDSIDVVPADWCAEALLSLATVDRIEHDVYHVSAGRESSVTMAEIDRVLARARGVPPIANSYRRVEKEDLVEMLPKMKRVAPEANRRLLLRAMQLYGGFAELNYVFDNARLRGVGLAPSPPLTRYLSRCVETARGIPIADQMKWDFK